MHHPVDGGCGRQRILENLVPLRKDQIGGDDYATAFVPFGQKGKQHLHFLATLLDVAEVIQNYNLKAVKPFEFPFQVVFLFGPQQAFNQFKSGREQHPIASLHPFVAQGGR